MRSLVSVSLLALALAAQASLIVIDDFTSLPQTVTTNTTGVNAVTYANGGTMLGGSRGLFLLNAVVNQGQDATFEVANGAFGSQGLGTQSDMYSLYGATGIVSPTSPAFFPSGTNGLALPGHQGWEFEWLGSDKGVNLIVVAGVFNGSGYDNKFWELAVPAGGPSTLALGPGQVTFGASLNTSALSYVYFGVRSPNEETDWGMTKFSAVVPEPASMAVLGLGLAALKRRRKSA